MEQIVVGWVALQLTGSPFLVALVGFYRMLPLFVLGIFGGALGDRYDRRRLVVGLQLGNVACIGVLAALGVSGRLAYSHLALAEIIMGASMALDWPSRRALTVDLVDRERLANAVALDASGQNVSRMVGPLLSGGLIAALSPSVTLVALAGLYLVNGLLVLRLPAGVAGKTAVRTQGMLAGLRSGVGILLRDQAIVGVLLITVWMNLLFFPYQLLLPVVAVDVLKTDSVGLGTLSAADGLGSLIGTLLLAGSIGARHHGRHFWASSLGGGLVLIAFAATRSFPAAALIQVVGGLARAGFSAYQTTIVLNRSSDELRSRAMGLLTIAIGVSPFGSLEIGVLAQAVGTSPAIGLNAALCTLLVAAVILRSRGLREA
jgi:MFS family permease